MKYFEGSILNQLGSVVPMHEVIGDGYVDRGSTFEGSCDMREGKSGTNYKESKIKFIDDECGRSWIASQVSHIY
jgi:hypothetical protein